MRGRELANPNEGGSLGQVRPGGEALDEAGRIELAAGVGVAQQRLRLGREGEVAAGHPREQRPHAEAVASEEELLVARSQIAIAKSPFRCERQPGPHSS